MPVVKTRSRELEILKMAKQKEFAKFLKIFPDYNGLSDWELSLRYSEEVS